MISRQGGIFTIAVIEKYNKKHQIIVDFYIKYLYNKHCFITHTKEKIMSDVNKMKMPEFKASKNGYEIRTDILAMAKDLVAQDFHVKFQGWEMTAERDPKTNQIVTKVGMPEFPGLDKVLETAEKMYSFVNQATQTQSKK